MMPPRQNHSRSRRQLSVAWQDSVWFPPVLAGRGARARRVAHWPMQIITDPTVCVARTIDPLKV